MSLWTPPGVSADPKRRDRSDRFNADVVQQSRTNEVCDRFNRELRLIDDRLEMRWFGEDTRLPGVVPGRYALVRTPVVGPRAVIMIHGPRGEFMEPTSAVFAKLAEGDMWNADARRDQSRRREAAERAAERQRRRETDDRHEELRDRWNAATRTWVSMSRDSVWSQNVRGRRGARR